MTRAIASAGANGVFRKSAEPLESLGIRVPFKTVQRVTEDVGERIRQERQDPDSWVNAEADAPANPADFMVLQFDGMRVRTLNDASETEPADAVDDASEDNDAPNAERTKDDWKEIKVGQVIRYRKGYVDEDGERVAPEPLLKTATATMNDIKYFGMLFRAEADRRGWSFAKQTVIVSDAGHGIPGLIREHFPDLPWVLDYYHVMTRLSSCAEQVFAEGPNRKTLFKHWKSLLYNGETDRLLKELTMRAEEHASRPATASELPAGSAGRVFWTHILYIEKYRDHMDYPTYRENGWPIGSGQIESFCKQIGTRMKAASKRWTHANAERMATLLAERASEDGRWEKRWPPQVYQEEFN